MPYTFWVHDKKIGETRFELATHGRKRAGTFHPTEHGMTVLPGITAMFPALVAFGDLCRREGLDVDDDSPRNAEVAMDAFADTPEGQRVIAAARQTAEVVVRDAAGRTMVWESLAITDLAMLASLPRRQKSGARVDAPRTGDPLKFIVSLTLAARGERGLSSAYHLGAKHREPAPN